MANPKNEVMMGRCFARPSLRKFNGGEVVKTKTKLGMNKKWIVENSGHEADMFTPSMKHSYYKLRRGAWTLWARSDNLIKVS